MHQGFSPKKVAIKSWLLSGREFDPTESKALGKPKPIVSAVAELLGPRASHVRSVAESVRTDPPKSPDLSSFLRCGAARRRFREASRRRAPPMNGCLPTFGAVGT